VTVPGAITGIRNSQLITHVYQLKACAEHTLTNPPIFPQAQIHTKTHTHTNVNSTEHISTQMDSNPKHQFTSISHAYYSFLVPLQVGVYEHF
jgi:hypothetical protein